MPKKPRRDEILSWLKKHPEAKRYVVIDDEDDELDELPLFQPSALTGLNDKIVRGVINYLNERTDEDMRSGRIERIIQNIHAAFKKHEG
jgi:hypothetical protein